MHTAQDERLDYLISVLQKQCTLNLPPFSNGRAAELAVQTVRACRQEFARDIKIIFNVFKNIDYEIYTRMLKSL